MSTTPNLGDFVRRDGDPNRPLFTDEGAIPKTATRAEFDAQCDAFARGLLRRGLRRGDRMGILSANRSEYVTAFMGAMRAGIVPAPINHKLPPASMAQIVADCGARLVLCDAARLVAFAPAAFSDVDLVDMDGDGPNGLAALLDPGPFEPVTPRPDEPAFTLYTSGSTGRPKGVLLSHTGHSWVAEARMRQADMQGERVLIAAPLYHMNALALSILVCASGAEAILLPQFEAVSYIEAINRHRITWLTAVPPMIAMMLREKAALARADFSSVRVVRMGSAPVNSTLAEQISTLLPQATIINAFGTTEGGPVVFGPHPDGVPTPIGSVGAPHPEVSVRLSGPEAPRAGVLEMKSPAVMLGYHNRPDVPSPITEDGYYVTGDVFRRDDDGFYFFLGRDDDMFVSGGESIFPGEVEAVIEDHPAVLQSCVVPVPDEIKGTKPVAFVVLRPGAAVDEEELKRYVLANAPAYQHPRRVWFMKSLPLAPTNKIDRKALRERAEAALAAPAERTAE